MGGAQPFVGMRRRHSNVDDRDVRAEVADTCEQRVGVADLGDYFDVVFGEQTRDTLANKRSVVGDHYSHGSSARTVVPCVGRLSIASVAPSASRRSRRPDSPDPVAILAPPTPSSVIVTRSTPDSRASVTDASVGDACFVTLVSASETTK